MKLLFDQNLSPRLAEAFSENYPGTAHVRSLGMERASDAEVWEFARANAFIVVTRDSDFHERSLVYGYPPKVIWVRRGNCSTDEIIAVLRSGFANLARLDSDDEAGFLILY